MKKSKENTTAGMIVLLCACVAALICVGSWCKDDPSILMNWDKQVRCDSVGCYNLSHYRVKFGNSRQRLCDRCYLYLIDSKSEGK